MDTATLNLFLPVAVFLLLMVLVFWSTVIRPQARAARRHEELIRSIEVGDKIVTAGGIHGKIVKLNEDSIVLEIAPGVRVTLDRRAVRRRVD